MHTRKKYLFWLITIFFILLLWVFQFKITENIPWWDDFHGIILPVFHLFSDISIWEKLKLFFSLNNEHRVVNDRLFLLIIYLISGTFQLKLLALIGFINLIAIFFVFNKVAKPLVREQLFLLPLVFLIFQAQYYESLQSLMVPFQNFSVILYVLLTFYILIYQKDKKIFFAMVFAILAIFSHGNGILALLIGMIILLFNKRYKQLFIWSLVSISTIALYFLGYKKPEWSSGVSPTEHPIDALRYAFEFFGAYALNITDLSARASSGNIKQIFPQLFGLILVLTFLIVLLNKYRIFSKDSRLAIQRLLHSKEDQFLITSFGFFFATGLMIGITRTGFPMLGRYTINSAFLIIVVYLFIVSNTKRSYYISLFTSVSTFLILGLTYFNTFDIAIFKKNNAITDGINFQKTGSWINQYNDSSHVMRLNPLLVEPYQNKKYVFPKFDLDKYQELNTFPTKEEFEFSIVGNYLEISSKPELKYNSFIEGNGVYFSFENSNYKFIFPALNMKNSLVNYLKTGSYFSNLHRTDFSLNILPSGQYKIYKITKYGNQLKKYDLRKTYFPNRMIN